MKNIADDDITCIYDELNESVDENGILKLELLCVNDILSSITVVDVDDGIYSIQKMSELKYKDMTIAEYVHLVFNNDDEYKNRYKDDNYHLLPHTEEEIKLIHKWINNN